MKMKRTVTVSCSLKRNFNLGNYESYAPMYTASEVIELDESDEFTELDYHKAYIGLRRIVQDEITGEKKRINAIKEGTSPLATDMQMYRIFTLAKKLGCSPYEEGGLTLNDLVKEVFPDLHPMSLTQQQAAKFIKYLNSHNDRTNQDRQDLS